MTIYTADTLPSKVEPARAIAMALSVATGKFVSADGGMVKLVLSVLHIAGWKIVADDSEGKHAG